MKAVIKAEQKQNTKSLVGHITSWLGGGGVEFEISLKIL